MCGCQRGEIVSKESRSISMQNSMYGKSLSIMYVLQYDILHTEYVYPRERT
jgi:hypothetical protein